MKPIEFHGHAVDMAELTDNWTVGRSEAGYRLWKLTRAPMDEVTACVDLCFEERAAERKVAEQLVEVLTTQRCSVCGKGFSRELKKCPHCEEIASENERKAQKKERWVGNVNRLRNTVHCIGLFMNLLLQGVGFLLKIIGIPLLFIVFILNDLTKHPYGKTSSGHSRRKSWWG